MRVLQLFRLPDGTMRVLVEGIVPRARSRSSSTTSDSLTAAVPCSRTTAAGAELEALMRNVLASFNEYVHLNRRIPDEVLLTANNITDPVAPRYTVAAHLLIKVPVKQQILEEDDALERSRSSPRPRERARDRQARAQDRGPGPLAGEQEPEGVLPQRAAQGDPQGAGATRTSSRTRSRSWSSRSRRRRCRRTSTRRP